VPPIAKESGLSEQRLGRKNIFSLCAKIGLMVLKAYTGFSAGQPGIHQQAGIAPISIEEMPTDKTLIGNLRLHWSRPKMCHQLPVG